MADDAHPAAVRVTRQEVEGLSEWFSAGTGTPVTAMAGSEANIQPEILAESSGVSDEWNMSVPSLNDLPRKSERPSRDSVLDGPIEEDETDRDGSGEQDIVAPGSPSYKSTASPANQDGTDSAAEDTIGENRGEAEGNATAGEIATERGGEDEGNAAAEDTTSTSRGEAEGDAAVEETTSEIRGEAEGNATAEDTTSGNRGEAEGDAMAEGSVSNESTDPAAADPEPAGAQTSGSPPDNMANCRVESTAATASVASKGSLSIAVDGTPGDNLPALTANEQSSGDAMNSASELAEPSSRSEALLDNAKSQGPTFLRMKGKGPQVDRRTARESLDEGSRPPNKTLETWATANSGEAQGRLKGRRGSMQGQVKAPRLQRRSSVFGGVKPLLGSHVGRVGTDHMSNARRGAEQDPQLDPGAGSRRAPARLGSRLNGSNSQTTSYSMLPLIADEHVNNFETLENPPSPMENQLEQGVYKNKRTALADRKRDLFEQRLTLTNVNDDLEKLRDMLGSELDASDEEQSGFELINAKEVPENISKSSKVINMTLNRSAKQMDNIQESRILTMDDLPEMGKDRKARWAGSLEGISLTQDMEKLLYMVGLYTNSVSAKEDEWIRLMPFMVLVYEAIVDGLLGYGYAPTPVRFQGHRMYLNLSQEAFSDMDALRSMELVQALKITSETYIHSTAFRVSPKGIAYLKARLIPQIKVAVQRFACMKVLSGGKTKMELLKVQWNTEEECYYLVGEVSETFLHSTVTVVEALSYVMSPYLSPYLSICDGCSGSLADRVPELVEATRFDIQADDFLAITMDSVRLLMTEWIPMGGNAIVALNDRLGSSERVQGGFFTAAVDKSPGSTLFKGNHSGLTNVRLIDYETYSHVSFEAEVFYPSDPGVVQLESFSVHCNEQGDVMFGGLLEATTGCLKDAISSDCISRLLVDICFDSSRVLSNLTDSHQRDMLECVMLSEPDKREKFNVIMADGIYPRLRAADVLTRGLYSNKIMQMVGDIRVAHDLGDHLVVIGRDSLLLCGPRSKEMEPTVMLYAKCYARSIFLKAVFSRCFIVVDILNQAHVLLEEYVNYPEILETVRGVVASVSEDMLLLQEVQRAMLDSIQGLEEEHELNERIHGPGFLKDELMEVCKITCQVKSLKRRALDLEKTINACVHDMHTMQQMLSVVDEAKALKLSTGLRDNTKNLEELFRDDSRNSTSLEIINVVFAGSLAFQCMDRITGSYLGIAQDIEWIAGWIRNYITGVPGVWLSINLVAWAMLAGFILWLMRRATYTANRIETSHQHVVAHIDEPSLRAFLKSKNLKGQSSEVDGSTTVNKYGWQEDNGGMWGLVAPKFELEIDERHAFLLGFNTQVNKQSGSLPLHRAQLMLLLQLCIQDVIDTGSVMESLGTFQESKASDNAGLEERLEFLETEYSRIHGNSRVPHAYPEKLKELVVMVRMRLGEEAGQPSTQLDKSSKDVPSIPMKVSGKVGKKTDSQNGLGINSKSGLGNRSRKLAKQMSTVMSNVISASLHRKSTKKRVGSWASTVAASFKQISMKQSEIRRSTEFESSEMSLFRLRRPSLEDEQ